MVDGVVYLWVVVGVEGFGQTGPYEKRGGFDSIAIATGGLLHITGPEVCLSRL